jgi:hypothetical protein
LYFSAKNRNTVLFEWKFLNPTYKEVRHVAAYDGMVLFAALGGYSGMLLGLSFFQIPEVMKSVFGFIRHCYQDADETVEKNCTKDNEIENGIITKRRQVIC